MNNTKKADKKAGAPETRVVIEYGNKPYVVKQGEREIQRYARCDEAESHAQMLKNNALMLKQNRAFKCVPSDKSYAESLAEDRGKLQVKLNKATAELERVKARCDALLAALRQCLSDWANESALLYETVEDASAAIAAMESEAGK